MLQATAEQIRLAQMIYDKNDADFEDKVNQVRNIYSVSEYWAEPCLVFFLHNWTDSWTLLTTDRTNKRSYLMIRVKLHDVVVGCKLCMFLKCFRTACL